jgi:hypothetical protein
MEGRAHEKHDAAEKGGVAVAPNASSDRMGPPASQSKAQGTPIGWAILPLNPRPKESMAEESVLTVMAPSRDGPTVAVLPPRLQF